MRTARKITLIALLWLIFVNTGILTSVDTVRRLNMSHAWWTRTGENFPGNNIIIDINGKNYIPYDLGQSMLMLPGDWLGEQLGKGIKNEDERQHFRETVVSFLIFVPINLLAVLTCFRFLKLLNYSEKIAGLSSIVWLLGSSVFFYSSFHQQNNQILLFVLISYQTALAYAIKAKKRLAILSGIALGIAFLTRITSILYAVSVLIFMIGCVARQYKFKPVSQCLRSIALWMAGFIPFVLLERILTYYRYGSPIATSTSLHLQVYAKADSLINPNAIAHGENSGFSFFKLLTKVKPEGLLAPLISPEKSIFIYDPLLLPCLILLFVCWKSLSRYIRWYVVTVLVSFLLHLYIYSWTSEWIEQGEWGARYHITSIHLLLIPLIPILIIGATKRITKNADPSKILLSAIAKFVVVMAILIQFTSIVLPYGLEANQQELGIGSRFRLVQRMYNISYMLDSKPNFQISKVEQKWQIHEPNRKVIWDLLPFRYQDKLRNNSSLNKFIPMLFMVWSMILIAAIASTLWMFVE